MVIEVEERKNREVVWMLMMMGVLVEIITLRQLAGLSAAKILS
jgi:hypothetical protein